MKNIQLLTTPIVILLIWSIIKNLFKLFKNGEKGLKVYFGFILLIFYTFLISSLGYKFLEVVNMFMKDMRQYNVFDVNLNPNLLTIVPISIDLLSDFIMKKYLNSYFKVADSNYSQYQDIISNFGQGFIFFLLSGLVVVLFGFLLIAVAYIKY